MIGAAGVTFLVMQFAPEAKGSALCIGSGGSVGREGPIVQIGSSFGSMIGQFLPMTQKQRITLPAAGAAGGIAATFNTPIGGILFAVELILNEVSTATLVPVAICAVTATYVSPYLRHMSAMLAMGAMFFLLMRFTGHYHVEGVGYSPRSPLSVAEVTAVRSARLFC